MRVRYAIFIGAVLVLLLVFGFGLWYLQIARRGAESSNSGTASGADASSAAKNPRASSTRTNVYAHNLLLRRGPSFRIYIRWLRGQMIPTRRNVNPSFDDPNSFVLDIQSGVVHANIGDIANFLNASGVAHSPLKNIKLSGDGNQIKLTGTVHKMISLPVAMIGTLSTTPDNRIQIHVTKLSVLKIPFKGLLGDFHVTIADLFHPQDIPGIQVAGNDVYLDTQQLLPPPHIRGQLTSVRIVNPDLEEIYGNGQDAENHVEQWRNFLRLSGGSIEFGKLTMHPVDLIMIDISRDAWFDLDLTNYQAQLVNGYTRITPQSGLQIFMPDLDSLPKKKASSNMSVEWLKNRNNAPPTDVTSK